ncbi:TSYL2 protein, partial [Orthonyx spaldingii]|nr:TSYL2 protein [Orthonyx spaldingii]
GLETPKEGMETPGEGTGGPKTTGEAMGSMENTEEAKVGLESTITHCLEQGKGGSETTREVTEGLETTKEAMGGLETSREVTGSLGTTNGRKGSLETALTRCLEQGRRSKRGLETTTKVLGSVESDASPGGDLKSTSRRKAKTPVRPKGGVETASTQCLEWERSRNGGLETTMEVLEGLETTREDTGSLQTTTIGHVKQDREQKGGMEPTTEPEEGLEPTPTACVGQSRGGPGLPDLVGVPEPAGVPVPKEHVAEESAVISLGEDEDEEEEEERDEGPARYLAALEAVQLELEAVEEEAARAFRRLRARFCLRRRPHLQRRNRLIQHIPGFWVTAFLNHPQLSAMISDRDEDALSYMTSLQVEEFGQTRPGCRIRFFFSVNPYFQNDVVAKEFVRGPSGHLVSYSTPIRWWQGQDPRSRPHKGPPAPRSFFTWFGDHSFPAGDRVAEVSPVLPVTPPSAPSAPLTPPIESGEDCVVILDDDEDVQEIPDDGDGNGVEEVPTEEPPNPPVGQKDPNR